MASAAGDVTSTDDSKQVNLVSITVSLHYNAVQTVSNVKNNFD